MKRIFVVLAALCAGCVVPTVHAAAGTGNVKITPLGSHDGEFCARDRAMVFEDPDGTRILYDAGSLSGRTMAFDGGGKCVSGC